MAKEDRAQNNKLHFHLRENGQPERFRQVVGGGSDQNIPARERNEHGRQLLNQIDSVRPRFESVIAEQKEAGIEEGFGLRVEFESFQDVELAFESLSRENQGVKLLNVRYDGHRTHALVFVPEGKIDVFEKIG